MSETLNNPWPCRAWMLCTPRTGSTFLCSLLNAALGIVPHDTGTIPERHVWAEHFTPEHCPHWEDFQRIDPIVSKLHIHWLEERGSEMPTLSTKILRLSRADRVAQTWSLLGSGHLGTCHVHNPQERADYLGRESHVSVSRQEWYDHFHAIERWNRLLTLLTSQRDCLDVIYEDVIADRERELFRIMDWLGVATESWHVPAETELDVVKIH